METTSKGYNLKGIQLHREIALMEEEDLNGGQPQWRPYWKKTPIVELLTTSILQNYLQFKKIPSRGGEGITQVITCD